MKKTAEAEGAEGEMLLAITRERCVEHVPFNRTFGIDLLTLRHEQVELGLAGNYVRNILHGGGTSAVLDLTGGLVAVDTAAYTVS